MTLAAKNVKRKETIPIPLSQQQNSILTVDIPFETEVSLFQSLLPHFFAGSNVVSQVTELSPDYTGLYSV